MVFYDFSSDVGDLGFVHLWCDLSSEWSIFNPLAIPKVGCTVRMEKFNLQVGLDSNAIVALGAIIGTTVTTGASLYTVLCVATKVTCLG